MSDNLLARLLGIDTPAPDPEPRVGYLVDRRQNPDGSVWVLVDFGGDFMQWVDERLVGYRWEGDDDTE